MNMSIKQSFVLCSIIQKMAYRCQVLSVVNIISDLTRTGNAECCCHDEKGRAAAKAILKSIYWKTRNQCRSTRTGVI